MQAKSTISRLIKSQDIYAKRTKNKRKAPL